jgi:hypothetical protein
MGGNTQTGLLLLTIGFGLAIISILIREACLMSILALVVLILSIIGILFIFLDRKSFSERHRKFASLSFGLYILAAILVVLVVIITVLAAFDLATSSTGQTISGEATIDFFNTMKDIAYMSMIIAVIYGIARTLLVHELEDKAGRIFLYGALVVIIAFTLIATIAVVVAVDSIILNIGNLSAISVDDFASLTEGLDALIIYDYLAIIPNLLYMIAFYIAYRNVDRITAERYALRKTFLAETSTETKRPESGIEELKEIPAMANGPTCGNCGSNRTLVCRDGTVVCEDCQKVLKDK